MLFEMGAGHALLLAVAFLAQMPPPDGGTPGARLVPALDAAKGKKAVAAWVAATTKLCKSRPDGGADRPERWHTVGLSDGADVSMLCEIGPRATALASGSLLQAGADEVLLDVMSGQSRALGEDQLIVMRATPAGYRFQQAGAIGNSFEARARVTVPAARDVVVLCERTGHGGLYPLPCGFFDQGYFSSRGGRAELELGSTTICGPTATLSLGEIALRDNQLVLEVGVEQATLAERTPDESPYGCTKKTIKSKKTFSISYAIDAKGAHRLAPIPKVLIDLAQQYDY
jgi:hypothetical protein